VATVPPSFTVRLAAMGKGLNAPTAFNKAKSFAASTFTTDASYILRQTTWRNDFCTATLAKRTNELTSSCRLNTGMFSKEFPRWPRKFRFCGGCAADIVSVRFDLHTNSLKSTLGLGLERQEKFAALFVRLDYGGSLYVVCLPTQQVVIFFSSHAKICNRAVAVYNKLARANNFFWPAGGWVNLGKCKIHSVAWF
jgi:hypothetical protein